MKVEFCKSGVIESFVRETQIGYNSKKLITESVSSEFSRMQALTEDEKKKLVIVRKDKKKDKLVIDGLEDTMNSISNDGLINPLNNELQDENKEVKVKVPGCVIAKPRRENIIPVYMGNNNQYLG